MAAEDKRGRGDDFQPRENYKKELICSKSQLMTYWCYENDLCQIALMRSKPIIQFRPATSTRRCIIKLRFTDANSGIMEQLCKSSHPEKEWEASAKTAAELLFLIENPFQTALAPKACHNLISSQKTYKREREGAAARGKKLETDSHWCFKRRKRDTHGYFSRPKTSTRLKMSCRPIQALPETHLYLLQQPSLRCKCAMAPNTHSPMRA